MPSSYRGNTIRRRSNRSPRPLWGLSQGETRTDERRARKGLPGPGSATPWPAQPCAASRAPARRDGERQPGRTGDSGSSSRGGEAGDVSRARRAELGPAPGGGGECAERQTRGGRRLCGGRGGHGRRGPGSPPASSAPRRRCAPHAPRSTAPSPHAPPCPPPARLPRRGRPSAERALRRSPRQLELCRPLRSPAEHPDPAAGRGQDPRASAPPPPSCPRTEPTPRRGAPAGG